MSTAQPSVDPEDHGSQDHASQDQAGQDHGRQTGSASLTRTLGGALEDWASALRLQQWSKNLLLFVPLFLTHMAGSGSATARVIVGVLALGLVASATYLLNDLNDLDFDRLHLTKRFRAIAAGHITVKRAASVAVAFLVVGLVIALILSTAFLGLIAVYLILTFAYAARLKREPLMDVAVIGALFALRLAMGAVLMGMTPSPWMIAFGLLFFFSLALAKRHSEVMRGRLGNDHKIAGRGYQDEDWPLTLGFGIASGLAALAVMLVIIALETQFNAAHMPYLLFAVPACLGIWLLRVWLFSHRMTLDDDPVLFAFKDWPSYVLAGVAILGFVLAG